MVAAVLVIAREILQRKPLSICVSNFCGVANILKMTRKFRRQKFCECVGPKNNKNGGTEHKSRGEKRRDARNLVPNRHANKKYIFFYFLRCFTIAKNRIILMIVEDYRNILQ